MSEIELLKTKAVCALVLHLNVEDFRVLKEYIIKKFGPGTIVYQRISFNKLYITDKPPRKTKEGRENG